MNDALILQKIFTPGKKYYDTSLMISVDLCAANDFHVDCLQMGVKKENLASYATVAPLSKFRAFACNIDCFGQLNGFKAFLKIIAESAPKAEDLAFIRKLIETVGNMVEHMNKEQWEANILPIAKAGVDYLSKISEAELKTISVKEQDIKDFTSQLQHLLKTCSDEDKLRALQPVEELELGIALKLLSLPSIERRIAGIGIIGSKLASIKQKWPGDFLESDARARSFADWLHNTKFVDLALSEPLHAEVFRRSASLLAFMYGWHMIEGEQIARVWELAQKTHDALQTAVYHVLESLALHLERKDFDWLLGVIKGLPLPRVTNEVVGVLNSLGKNEHFRNVKKTLKRPFATTKEPERLRGGTRGYDGVKAKRTRDDFDQGNFQDKRRHRSASGDKNDFTQGPQQQLIEAEPYIRDEVPIDLTEPAETFCLIQFLWGLVQEEAAAEGLVLTVQARITDLFITLLTKFFGSKCKDYMKDCEEQLVADKSALQMGKIYPRLVEFACKDKSFKFQPTVPDFLAKIVMNLIRFKRAAAQKAITLFMRDSKEDRVSENRYETLQTNEVLHVTYYSELEQRLTLINFLVERAKLPISTQCVAVLWQTFVLYSFSDKETAGFFDFMQNLTCTEVGVQLVIDGAFDSFFEEALLRMDPKEYTTAAFNCLKNIVLALNSYYRHVKTLPGATGIEILSDQLIGIQAVWDIALDARDEEVHKMATSFLQAMYRKVAPESAKFEPEIKEGFVKTCMRQIKTGTKMLEETKDCTRISRALEILTTFVEESDRYSASPSPSQQQGYEFLVATSWQNKDKRSIKVCSTMTVREMLEAVKKVQERPEPLEDLLFFAKGGAELKPSAQTIHEAGINSDTWISVASASKDVSQQLHPQNQNLSQAEVKTQQQAQQPSQQQSQGQNQAFTAPESASDMAARLSHQNRHVNFKPPEVSFAPVPAEVAKQLSEIFPDYQPALLQAALRKAKNDVNQASILLMEPGSLAEIQADAAAAVIEETSSAAPVTMGVPVPVVAPKTLVMSPAGTIISGNEEYFMTLYQLFDGAAEFPEVLEKVWSLLMKIPTNPFMLEQFVKVSKAAGEIPWDQLIPADSPYKLAYALRIVMNILDSAKRCAEWAEPFISQGGFNQLLMTLISLPVADKLEKHAAPVTLKAVEMAVTVIKDFASAAFLQSPTETYKLFLQKTATSQESVVVSNQNQQPQKPEGSNYKAKLVLNSFLSKRVLDEIEQFQLPVNLVSILGATAEDKDNKASAALRKTLANLLSAILCYDLRNFNTLFPLPLFSTYLLDTFLTPGNENSRETLKREVLLWFEVLEGSSSAAETFPPAVFVLNTLLTPIFEEKAFPIRSEPYFQFLGELLSAYSSNISSPIYEILEPEFSVRVQFSSKKLAQQTLKLLHHGPETPDFDVQFTGCLHLLAKLTTDLKTPMFVTTVEASAADFGFLAVICKEIFGLSRRRCGTGIGLTAAVKLALEFAGFEPHRTRILGWMANFQQEQFGCTIKDPGNESGQRGPGTYVGLKNFGCTCYINSLLQQLFMMVELREELMKLPTERIVESKGDNVIPNLQKIFSYLMFSQQQYYAPGDFCKEFKGYNKQSINVHLQQDVDEFFNLLTEKAENELKLVDRPTLFRDLMKIVVLQEINSLEEKFPYMSPKEEEYLSLPLDIKGKHSIEDALDSFVKEELLEGDNMYRCDKYQDQKIRAVKKFSIKQLPKILVVNLKRFEFNYASGTKNKLNDYCEFPTRLNFQKWTKTDSAKDPTEFDYDLVGVLLHSGTADGGHYFSYIKERDKSSPNYGRWFEFNDTRVSPFSVSDLKQKAFGSQKPKGTYDAFGWDTSAYLLVYQKSGSDVSSAARLSVEKNSYAAAIIQENLSAANAKIYLNPNYQTFVKEFTKLWSPVVVTEISPADSDSYDSLKEKARAATAPMKDTTITEDEDTLICKDSPPYMTLCRMAAMDAHNLLEKRQEINAFREWVGILTPHLKANARFCVWYIKFVTKYKASLFNLLIENAVDEARDEYSALITSCVQTVALLETSYINIDDKFSHVSGNTKVLIERVVPKAAVARFISLLINEAFSYARVNWRRFDQFFGLLCRFACLNVECARRAVNEGLIGKLIDFLSNTDTPLDAMGTNGNRPKMGDKLKEANFRQPLKLLSLLVRSCSTVAMREKSISSKYALYPAAEIPVLPPLPYSEVELLFSPKWRFPELATHSKEDLCSMLIHLSWDDGKMAESTIVCLTKYAVEKHLGRNYVNELEMIKELLLPKDSVTKQRAHAFLYTKAEFAENMYEWMQKNAPYFCEFVLDLLNLLAQVIEVREIAECVKEDAEKMKWAVDWVAAEKLHILSLDGPEETRKKEFVKKQFESILNWKAIPIVLATQPLFFPEIKPEKMESDLPAKTVFPVINVLGKTEESKKMPLDDVVDLDSLAGENKTATKGSAEGKLEEKKKAGESSGK